MTKKIFLDNDGVLADFDKLATEILGMPARVFEDTYGIKTFWKTLRDYDDNGKGFFECLPLMPDAMELVDAVRHLNPTILTGCPVGDWAPEQKQKWKQRHFPEFTMITCMAKEKSTHVVDGCILVDDMLKYRHLWEEAGGNFIHHTDAKSSIAKLHVSFPDLF